jgi:hypothetical protein
MLLQFLQTGESVYENANYKELATISSVLEGCEHFVDRDLWTVEGGEEEKILEEEWHVDHGLLPNEEVGR